MPTYCFISDDGEQREEVHSMASAPQKVRRNGKVFRRDYQRELGGGTQGFSPACWPFTCWTQGVSPSQRQEAMKAAEAAGCPTYYDEKGRAVIRDKAHYKAFQKMNGVVNRDGGYSG